MRNNFCYTFIAEAYIRKATCFLTNRLMFCERDKGNYIRQTAITYFRNYQICLMYLPVLIPDFSYAMWPIEITLFSKLNWKLWKLLAPLLMCPDHCELSSSIPPVTKRVKGLAGILKKVVQDETSVSSGSSVPSDTERVEKETNYYFDLPAADLESDPLHWWRSERKHFPILAMLAQKYLCIFGTSVPSERLFSKSGFIVNEFRSRLKPESVDKLVFLARNTS